MNPSLRVLLALSCAACATSERSKGPLQAFGPRGFTAPGPAKKIALVVGVNRFEDERFHELRWAATDAAALGKAIDGVDRLILLNTPETTSRAAVLSALERLEHEVISPEDTVIVYFSTHGTLGRRPGGDLERFLVLHDTRLDLVAETGLAMEAITSRIERLISNRKLLILATCHSGLGKSTLSDPLRQVLAARKGPLPMTAVSEALIMMTAASFSEPALEDDQLGHDVYTYYLLESLERGDGDGDGAVTASEAHDYARERTYAFTDGLQRPTMASAVIGRDPIVLRGSVKRAGLPILQSYEPSSEGLELWVDGRPKGRFPGSVPIEPGARHLEIRAGERPIWAGEIRLAPGEARQLVDLLPAPLRLQVSALGGVTLPLAGAARDNLGTMGHATLRATTSNWPWPHLELGLDLDYRGSSGTVSGQKGPLPFRAHVARAGLYFGAAVPLGALHLRFGGGGGMLWAERQISSGPFRATDQLRGVDLGLESAAELAIIGGLHVGLRLGLRALFAKLGPDTGPHPLLDVGVLVGFED